MNALLQKVLEWAFKRYAVKRFPGCEKLLDNLKLGYELAEGVVMAAESEGGTGEAKKAKATQSLLDLLKKHNLDIPGDKDKEICGLIIEATVTVLNRFI